MIAIDCRNLFSPAKIFFDLIVDKFKWRDIVKA